MFNCLAETIINYMMLIITIDHNIISERGDLTCLQSNTPDTNTCSVYTKDFDFQTLSKEELKYIKMPYANYNRKIFCNSDIDLIDLFMLDGKKLVEELKLNINDIILNITNLLNLMKTLFDFNNETNSKYKRDRAFYLKRLSTERCTDKKRILNNEFTRFVSMLEIDLNIKIDYDILYILVHVIDNYVFDYIDKILLNFHVKPSVVIKCVLENNKDDYIMLRCALLDVINIYNCALSYYRGYIRIFSGFDQFSSQLDVLIPNVLLENIVLKWNTEHFKDYIYTTLTKSNIYQTNKMFLIYAIHTFDGLLVEMARIIDKIVIGIKEDESSDRIKIFEKGNKVGIIFIPEYIEYEITVLDKVYIIPIHFQLFHQAFFQLI